ncbi:MAG TPA: hypothetical protein VM537_05055, partial [Anaerolineae bacterium]|nr:hypothetical protein [Anaerolineae bacterium]
MVYDDARLENTFVEFSKVGLGAAASTPAQQAEVKRYVEYVLGTEQTEVLFKDLEEAGSFADLSGAEALAISIHALDPLSVGFHEAAHALVSRLRAHDQRSANVLLNAASSPLIQARLRELLKGEPGALEQLADPEERVAYMYQFWAVDKLAVGPKTDTIFQKIKVFLRAITKTVLGVGDNPTQMLQAEMIFRAFHTGKLAQRGAVAEVMSKIVPRDTATQGALGRVGDTAERLWATSDGYIRDFNIPAMTGIANQMFNPGEGGSGMMQTRHIKRNQFMNRVNDVLAKLDSGSEARVLKALQSGKPRAGSLQNTGEARAVGEIRKVLDEIFKYMQESNVKVVEWSAADESYVEHTLRAVKDFFPRSYDREYIEANMNSFAAMLRKNGVPESKIKKTMKNLLKGTKADAKESDFTAGLTFYAPNTMARKLDIPETELEPFLQKDLRSIMYNYVAYTVRRAEYASRFGNQGQKIEEVTGRLASVTKDGDKIPPVAGEAERQGASVEQLKAFSNYVRAMEGSLGDEISPNMRGFMGAVLTYQNMRLLPLALFSSLVDPNGIALRSGDWKQSPKAFVRGLRELVKDLPDADRDFAKLVGAVNSATDQHMVADMYGANYSGRWQKWLNEKLFKLNGMESWNNSMRIVAANAGRQFIIRHATKPNKHSERYLRELGLEKADVQFTDTLVPGDNNSLVAELDLTPQMVDAINKFVDGAVLRSHAGVRPIWMSDPHFMLISNLKQFTYSFQTTIVKRTVHEAMHGNYTPLLVLSSYVPFIIASDIMRAMVSPGGADD